MKGCSKEEHNDLKSKYWEYIKNSEARKLENLLKNNSCARRNTNEPETTNVPKITSYNAEIFSYNIKQIRTALISAIQNNANDIAKILIDHGADTNLCDEDTITSIHHIDSQKQISNLQAIIPFTRMKHHPLYVALTNTNSVIAQRLMDEPNTHLQTESWLICFPPYHSDLFQRETPMLAVTRMQDLPMVKSLITAQNKKDSTAIKAMVNHGQHTSPLTSLFRYPKRYDENKSPLIAAYLLRYGTDINNSTPFNQIGKQKNFTALHYALTYEQYEMCKLLISTGADTTRIATLGRIPADTPEHIANRNDATKDWTKKQRTDIAPLSFLAAEQMGNGLAENATTAIDSIKNMTSDEKAILKTFAHCSVKEYRHRYLDNYIAKMEALQ